jgi:Transposase DDE domain group 1
MAYVLFDMLRRDLLRGTRYEHATFDTLRLKLIKLGARVRELKTHIKIELPTSCPVQILLQDSFGRLSLPVWIETSRNRRGRR